MTRSARLALLAAILLVSPLLALGAGCTLFGARQVDRPAELEVGQKPALRLRWSRVLTSKKLWQYHPQEFGSAEIDPAGNRVFIGNRKGVLFALDRRDGSLIWQQKLEGAVSSRPRYVAEHDTLLVGTDGGYLYRLDARDGRVRWKYETKGTMSSRPFYAPPLVYAMNNDEYLYAIDFEKGTWRWHYHRAPPDQFTVHGVASPIVADGKVYIGFADGYLVALWPLDGGVLWARYLAASRKDLVDVDSTPYIDGKTLYVTSYAGGVNAVDATDGHVIWTFPVEGATSVAPGPDSLFVVAPHRGLHRLTPKGELVWRQAIPEGTPTTPVVYGGLVVFTLGDKGLYVADTRGNLREFINPGEGISAPAVGHEDELYVLSNQGTLYAYQLLPD